MALAMLNINISHSTNANTAKTNIVALVIIIEKEYLYVIQLEKLK